ncbi:TIGR04141 family sporadically distributed protein, partial [Vibrio vulnificus]|uniref:TIGR04141 family sporadically distributed protein n=1 Tax=Vibrio vulnificus TaxID=672 RepID=UPI001CDC359E|nr:TIGR04141 family sporadically distributed protein [Vibrio vulnificus]
MSHFVLESKISGCGTTFSFGKSIKVEDIPDLVDVIFDHYKSDAYQASFSWVDNIRRLQEPADIQPLDDRLLSEIKNNSSNVTITIPEMIVTRAKPICGCIAQVPMVQSLQPIT